MLLIWSVKCICVHDVGCRTRDKWNSAPLNGQALALVSPTQHYQSDRLSNSTRKSKLSIFEMFYNMTSLLASVALGYDIRSTNMFPLTQSFLREASILRIPHIVQGEQILEDDDVNQCYILEMKNSIGQNSNETNISVENKISMSYTDNFSKMLSPDRLSSSLSTDSTQRIYPWPINSEKTDDFLNQNTEFAIFPPLGQRPQHESNSTLIEGDNYLGDSSDAWFLNDNNFYATSDMRSTNNSKNPFVTNITHSDRYGSNYFSSMLDTNYTHERSYKSYPDYNTFDHHVGNSFQQNNVLEQNDLDSHLRTISACPPTSPPRVPQMGVSVTGHPRAPSSVWRKSNSFIAKS